MIVLIGHGGPYKLLVSQWKVVCQLSDTEETNRGVSDIKFQEGIQERSFLNGGYYQLSSYSFETAAFVS